jgi:general secretion pathway protein I
MRQYREYRLETSRGNARRNREKGFTLIEVVIALAILGIGLTVIIELFSGGLRLGRISQEYTKAMNFASLKMEEIVTEGTIEPGEGEGEFNPIFRWRTGIEKVDILPYDKGTEFKPPVDLYRIRVNVLWKSGAKERSASLESYRVAKPAS